MWRLSRSGNIREIIPNEVPYFRSPVKNLYVSSLVHRLAFGLFVYDADVTRLLVSSTTFHHLRLSSLRCRHMDSTSWVPQCDLQHQTPWDQCLLKNPTVNAFHWGWNGWRRRRECDDDDDDDDDAIEDALVEAGAFDEELGPDSAAGEEESLFLAAAIFCVFPARLSAPLRLTFLSLLLLFLTLFLQIYRHLLCRFTPTVAALGRTCLLHHFSI